MNIYEPFYYFFQNRGYNPRTRRSRVISMGRTHDSASVTTPKAYLVNFRIVNVDATSDGALLHFTYGWDSSTGRLSDLSRYRVREYVNFPTEGTTNGIYYAPSPPFPAGTKHQNPFAGTEYGAELGGIDDYNGLASTAFVKPYKAADFLATQYLQYRCPGINNGKYVILSGPISITIAVYPHGNGTPGDSWYYFVSKSGYKSTIDPLP